MDENETDKRSQFGNRYLTDSANVFEHNAWDNVEWDHEQEKCAQETVQKNSSKKLTPDEQEKFESNSGHYWNEFYAQHQNRFFKDRHWLFTEFPELAPVYDGETESKIFNSSTEDDKNIKYLGESAGGKNEDFPGKHSSFRMFEVGCGVGNTVFPILQTSNDPNLFVYCCDLSANAIQLVKENPDYNIQRCHAFVCDITDPESTFPFPKQSLDVIVLIFVFSAINPEKMAATMRRLSEHLKPGGLIVFRDYGRYDLTQLRFKTGRCLGDNFYVRGDGTKVYFFTQDELCKLFTDAGLTEEQNLIDRRLQVNRGKQIKMYRVWIQCKYRKPKLASST